MQSSQKVKKKKNHGGGVIMAIGLTNSCEMIMTIGCHCPIGHCNVSNGCSTRIARAPTCVETLFGCLRFLSDKSVLLVGCSSLVSLGCDPDVVRNKVLSLKN